MRLFKAMALGLAAAAGIPAVVRHGDGMMVDMAVWHSLSLNVAGFGLIFSLPLFLGVTLFGWFFFYLSRD